MSALAQSQTFFVSGGTMSEGALSYVERSADSQLFEKLLAGHFCYVLNSRQMGKSSLCVRTKARLEAAGSRTVFIDLTKIGGKNVTADQWYAGITIEVGRALGFRQQVVTYWKENDRVSPMQRLFDFLREVALEEINQPIVIFIDEIDSTRSLSFDTDEFFAGIRECYNRRVHDPAYNRLTFCLLGVAVPSDLIRNTKSTPFNIGERIYLKDFTREEARALGEGLPEREFLVERVFYWTNGHPFLTQSLCTAIANNSSIRTPADVDALVARDLLDPKARETNINLADVGARVLTGLAQGDDPERYRANVLSAYEKVVTRREPLQDDEANHLSAVLKLSGLMRSEGRTLKVRNRIYERAFDRSWIRENMPGQELRRQRRAFLVGTVRTGAVAAVVISAIGYMAFDNYRLRILSEETTRKERYQNYVVTMNSLPMLYQQGNVTRMRELLKRHESDPTRGFEWNFWDRMAHQPVAESEPTKGANTMGVSPDGSQILCYGKGVLKFYDAHTARLINTFTKNVDWQSEAHWTHDQSKVLLAFNAGGGLILSSSSGNQIADLPKEFTFLGYDSSITNDSRTYLARSGANGDLFAFDLTKRTARPLGGNGFANYSLDNNMLVHYGYGDAPYVRLLDGKTLEEKRRLKLPDMLVWPVFSADAKHVCGGVGGRLFWMDVVSGEFKFFGDLKGDIRAANLVRPNWYLISTSLGYLMCIDLNKGTVAWDLKVSDAPAWDLHASRSGRYACLTAINRLGMVFEVGEKEPKIIRSYPEAVRARVLPDNETFVTQYANIQIYKIDSPEVVATAPMPALEFGWRFRQFDRDSFITRGPNGAKLYEIKGGKFVHVKDIPNYENVATAEGNFYALQRRDKNLVVHNFVTQTDLASIKNDSNDVMFDAAGPDKVVLCFNRNLLELWDMKSNERIAQLSWPARIEKILSDRLGKQLAVFDQDRMLSLVDLQTGKVRWRKTKVDPKVDSWFAIHIRFSRDGSSLVTANDDDKADIWDAKSGMRVQTFVGHAQSVLDADISPDGRRIVTTSNDQTLRVWDAQTGQELCMLGTAGGAPNRCYFSWDGDSIITVDDARRNIRVWPITPR